MLLTSPVFTFSIILLWGGGKGAPVAKATTQNGQDGSLMTLNVLLTSLKQL